MIEVECTGKDEWFDILLEENSIWVMFVVHLIMCHVSMIAPLCVENKQ